MSSRRAYELDQVGIRMVKEPPLYSAEPVNSPQAAVRLMSQTLKGSLLGEARNSFESFASVENIDSWII